MSNTSKNKQHNINLIAILTMLAGVVVTLIALYIIPRTSSTHSSLWLTYDANTGAVGDTIGGIAGPILNFTGLIILFLSLWRQSEANEIQSTQVKNEIDRSRNEREFDLAYKLVEKLNSFVEKQEDVFDKLPQLDYEINIQNFNGRMKEASTPGSGMGGFDFVKQGQLRKYFWVFRDFEQYFSIAKSQIQSSKLEYQQAITLVSLIEVGYGRKLSDARIGYQESYQDGFSYSEDKKDSRPELLKMIDRQFQEIQELRMVVESKKATESMPYGDDESNS